MKTGKAWKCQNKEKQTLGLFDIPTYRELDQQSLFTIYLKLSLTQFKVRSSNRLPNILTY